MADEVEDSIKFAFEWRKFNFKTLFLYLVVLNLVWVAAELVLKANVNWIELVKSLPTLLSAVLVLLLALLVLSFVSSVIQLLVMSFALKSAKMKTRAFTAVDFVKFYILNLVAILASVFSVFNIRGLAVLGASIIFAVLAAALQFWPLWLVFGILVFVYVGVIFYNLMRLSQTPLFFAGTNKSLTSSMRQSLDATLGNVLWLLLLYVVVLIVIAIAVFIIVMGPALIAGAVGGGMDSLAYKIVYAVLNPISVLT